MAHELKTQSKVNFNARVWEITKKIPAGRVTTYGSIAQMLGNPRLSRQVGWALHANQSSDVPCHRVVNREGRLAPNFGGPSLKSFGRRAPSKPWRSGAFDGWKEQRRRLLAENVKFKDDMHVNLERFLWRA
ncbi:MAG: MGMT family protein [Candidatus Curtissbacteria bacterium]